MRGINHVFLVGRAGQDPERSWAWTFWECEVTVPEGAAQFEVMCKATDVAYNVQPESAEPIWNIRGLNNNSWHRMRYPVDTDDEEEEEEGDGPAPSKGLVEVPLLDISA